MPPHVPYALDADVADTVYWSDGESATRPRSATCVSVDRTRRLFEVVRSGDRLDSSTTSSGAFDLAALATSAQLLGAGERLLADSVAYVKQRKQFGREIGSYQAIKHPLADVRIALDFARPLVFGAALGATSPASRRPRWPAGDAAYLASRTALQVHGAIGYTAELDLSPVAPARCARWSPPGAPRRSTAPACWRR